jgi:hypothetical protein
MRYGIIAVLAVAMGSWSWAQPTAPTTRPAVNACRHRRVVHNEIAARFDRCSIVLNACRHRRGVAEGAWAA